MQALNECFQLVSNSDDDDSSDVEQESKCGALDTESYNSIKRLQESAERVRELKVCI